MRTLRSSLPPRAQRCASKASRPCERQSCGESGSRASTPLLLHSRFATKKSPSEPRHTPVASRPAHGGSAARCRARAASSDGHTAKSGSRPSKVFHCTNGSDGRERHATIVKKGSGVERFSYSPWQKSSKHTRASKSVSRSVMASSRRRSITRSRPFSGGKSEQPVSR